MHEVSLNTYLTATGLPGAMLGDSRVPDPLR